MCIRLCFVMYRRPPMSKLTDTLFPPRRSSDLDQRDHRRADQRERLHQHAGSDEVHDPEQRRNPEPAVDQQLGLHPRCATGRPVRPGPEPHPRSEEHTSALQSLMRNSYAVFCLKNKKPTYSPPTPTSTIQ